jgi:hypothetical protein
VGNLIHDIPNHPCNPWFPSSKVISVYSSPFVVNQPLNEEEEEGLLPPKLPEVPAYKK